MRARRTRTRSLLEWCRSFSYYFFRLLQFHLYNIAGESTCRKECLSLSIDLTGFYIKQFGIRLIYKGFSKLFAELGYGVVVCCFFFVFFFRFFFLFRRLNLVSQLFIVKFVKLAVTLDILQLRLNNQKEVHFI